METLRLEDRRVIRVTGTDAASFLNGLVTAGLEDLPAGTMRSAALLTPQGKVLFDMLISRFEDGFVLDVHADLRDTLAKRLGFYKLRADVAIDTRDDLVVLWTAKPADETSGQTWFIDPRLAALGARRYAVSGETGPGAATYHARRIGFGVAECGVDFGSETTFPHEANMDALAGIDFAKGCFVGQEVVSRMQHRGTARKRFVPCRCDGPVPDPGTEITLGDRVVGAAGSGQDQSVLALLRLDRIAGSPGPLDCGGARLTPVFPAWLPRPEVAA